ncbi:MAG: hypothetical protein ACFE8F_05370 [Promethearchaeota archaeon]
MQMIYQLYHFHKSGLVLTSVGFGPTAVNVSPELVSGFLSALRMFSQDLLSDDVTTIETGNYQFVWDFADPVMSVALADREDDDVSIMAVLKTLNALFLDRFQKELKRWTGEVAHFREFNPVAREVVNDYLPTFEKPKEPLELRPAIIRLWRRFGPGLDILLYGLLRGIPILTVGKKSRNQSVIRALQTMQRRRIPVMYFEDAGAALQVLQDRPPNMSFILSLPQRAYESTFADASKMGLTYVCLLIEEHVVLPVGFESKSFNIAETVAHAEKELGESSPELRSVAETAFLTIRDRIDDVARLLAKSPGLPEDEAAQLLRLSAEDFAAIKELAEEGGYLRRERKRIGTQPE